MACFIASLYGCENKKTIIHPHLSSLQIFQPFFKETTNPVILIPCQPPTPAAQQLWKPTEESTAPSAQLGVGHGADGSPGLGGGAVLHDGAALGAWKMAGDADDTWGGNHRNLWYL